MVSMANQQRESLMPTNGKCVRCGYRAPVSSFIEASGDGEILAEYIKLPQVVQQPFYKYLSLFRPASGCACQQSKIIRLTREMVALVASGYVAHTKKGRVDRPCLPQTWAQGMERMVEQAATLDLPMDNHNYLRAVVWQIADQADAGREQLQRKTEIDGSQRVIRPQSDPQQMSAIMRKYIEIHGDQNAAPAGGSDDQERR